MTALTIIAIVVLGIVGLLDVIATFGAEGEISGLGFVNMIAVIFAIVTLSIWLGQ